MVALISAAATVLVVALAARFRGRFYATFAGVLLSIHSLVASAMADYFTAIGPLYFAFHAAVYLHFAGLVFPNLRPLWYRLLVSIPGSFFAAATFLAWPWAIASAFGLGELTFPVPYAVATLGLFGSTLLRRKEVVRLWLDGAPQPQLGRAKSAPLPEGTRPLRVVQITDPHLGTFMTEAALRRISEDAVAADPDLVLLTGDFLTMESHRALEVMTRAFEPLAALKGRVFACMGNHDHEAPDTVLRALLNVGATMLIDDARTVTTRWGELQIVGLDFHFRERREKIQQALRLFPRKEGVPRLVMLHDPGAFVHIPDGDADLVFSGHTHGGQLGLVNLGLPGTFVSLFTKIPDHGFWGLGKNRLYVHRGTGHYGFPIRVGVPPEESVLEVGFAAAPGSATSGPG